MTHTIRLTLKGGWIDASFADGTLRMAAVGPPLQYLVKAPTSIPARHRQLEERARLRRLAVERLEDAGAPAAEVGEAEVAWSYRAG